MYLECAHSGACGGEPVDAQCTEGTFGGNTCPTFDDPGGGFQQPPPPPPPGGKGGGGKGSINHDWYCINLPFDTVIQDGTRKSFAKYQDEVKIWRRLARERFSAAAEDQVQVLLLSHKDKPEEVALQMLEHKLEIVAGVAIF